MEVNTEAVKTLIDLGGSAILTVMLWLVWRRLNDVTDRLIDIVSELRLNTLAVQTKPPEKTTEP